MVTYDIKLGVQDVERFYINGLYYGVRLYVAHSEYFASRRIDNKVDWCFTFDTRDEAEHYINRFKKYD